MSIRHDAMELAALALDLADGNLAELGYARQDRDGAISRLRRATAIILLWQRREARAKVFVGEVVDEPQCDAGRTEPL